MHMAMDGLHTGLRVLTGHRGSGLVENSQGSSSSEKLLQSPSRSSESLPICSHQLCSLGQSRAACQPCSCGRRLLPRRRVCALPMFQAQAGQPLPAVAVHARVPGAGAPSAAPARAARRQATCLWQGRWFCYQCSGRSLPTCVRTQAPQSVQAVAVHAEVVGFDAPAAEDRSCRRLWTDQPRCSADAGLCSANCEKMLCCSRVCSACDAILQVLHLLEARSGRPLLGPSHGHCSDPAQSRSQCRAPRCLQRRWSAQAHWSSVSAATLQVLHLLEEARSGRPLLGPSHRGSPSPAQLNLQCKAPCYL